MSVQKHLIDEAREHIAEDRALPLDLVFAMAGAGLDVEGIERQLEQEND